MRRNIVLAGLGGVLLFSGTASAAPPRNDFTLSARPSKVTVKAGKQSHFTIAVPRGPGYYARIGLDVSGLPRGTSGGFTPLGAGYDPHRTLLIATRTTARRGTYRLTITARGGSRVHHAHVTLVIHH